ncbi:molybdopterin-dependent oxidoreductase [Ornithinimicrobium pekingense]|uniref:Oxidoreductase n=1 Tax=Ornithinimicrobium pekingense TaxID=384677 RepID=A0ABQ2F882_9MICO|nr:molybdopterin-dependent oxidoreductase [Ornithinimicrobium pekingense]GGK69443.1 oxidoreductase [Ornithinimicrobium pekingense]
MDGAGGTGRDAGLLPPGQRPAPRWRASHYGKVPVVDAETWTLTLCGAVRDPGALVLDLAAVESLPHVEVTAGLHCVDRHSVPAITWGGVRLRDVVALAPPEDGAVHALLAARRGYSSSALVEDLLHPDALLATTADGRPLTREHGWPARVVLPHLYGFKGPKWIAEISFHHTPQQGYWESHGYHPRGRVDLEERWAHQG